MKAKQLMSSFQSQGMQGSTSIPSSSEEKLRSQISQQTNEILQLQDDKEDLENKIEELKELSE
jgi:hypothetical protein